MAYEIDYNDEKFQQVEQAKDAAIKESNATYDSMIDSSDSFYQAQIDATNEYAETQKNLQQEQTDFAIEQIEQQKEQTYKDYQKEQSGAYVDWQKQSNQYGANAEQTAASGLGNTGYSESSQVAMYNQYQNRVAVARESYNKAVLSYDNAIKDARLQNNSALAEIAYNALQTSLNLSLQGFQYKNQLILDKANRKTEIDNTYYSRYQDVLGQINYENSFNEQVRQYNKSLAEEKRQYNKTFSEQRRQYEKSLAEEKRQYNKSLSEEKRQYNKSLSENKRQHNETLAEDKRQYNETMAYNKSFKTGGGGKSSGVNSTSVSNQRLEKNQKVDTPETSSSSASGKLNPNSVNALGIGPINGDEVAKLVDEGYVSYDSKTGNVAWTEKGKAKYGKKPTASSYASMNSGTGGKAPTQAQKLLGLG